MSEGEHDEGGELYVLAAMYLSETVLLLRTDRTASTNWGVRER